jgi:tRNA 2-thiouridine synthesizing protein C
MPLLLIFRHGPYGYPGSRGGYDLALAAAAFEQPVSILFIDDGVWHLLPGQSADRIDRKSIEKTLASLSLYDIDRLYVDAASLHSRGLAPGDLVAGLSAIDGEQARSLVDGHPRILVF